MFACSGPGAGAAIAQSIRIGNTHAAVLALLLLVSVGIAIRGRGRIVPFVLLVLLALHPAWTIDAIRGDCGFFKVGVSWIVTGISGIATLWQIIHALGAIRSNNTPPGPTSN